MSNLSAEDKGKGKRIITQFFRTMPGVQKSLLTLFEKDGYTGVYKVQNMLYPSTSQDIDSTDTLRKGLSMILQHIYGMPVEDKEGYFQDILKCKTAGQVIRKEKETLINYFYKDAADLRNYLLSEIVEDNEYHFINILLDKFFEDEEPISDMRSFKNQLRNLSEVLTSQISSGASEDTLIAIIKEHQVEYESAQAEQQAAPPDVGGDAGPLDEAEQKKQAILNTLNEAKYQSIRDFLIQSTAAESNFSTFQLYLDNILSPSAPRLVADNMETFTAGVKKIKELRDNLEKELS